MRCCDTPGATPSHVGLFNPTYNPLNPKQFQPKQYNPHCNLPQDQIVLKCLKLNSTPCVQYGLFGKVNVSSKVGDGTPGGHYQSQADSRKQHRLPIGPMERRCKCGITIDGDLSCEPITLGTCGEGTITSPSLLQ
jgi:hypothetical protein